MDRYHHQSTKPIIYGSFELQKFEEEYLKIAAERLMKGTWGAMIGDDGRKYLTSRQQQIKENKDSLYPYKFYPLEATVDFHLSPALADKILWASGYDVNLLEAHGIEG